MIQRFQNKILRSIVNAPWYIRNDDIHKDLKIAPIAEEIQRLARKHEERLHQHQNVEMLQILDNSQQVRRLNRVKPFELVVWSVLKQKQSKHVSEVQHNFHGVLHWEYIHNAVELNN